MAINRQDEHLLMDNFGAVIFETQNNAEKQTNSIVLSGMWALALLLLEGSVG